MKPLEQYFHMVLLIIYVDFKSVDEILLNSEKKKTRFRAFKISNLKKDSVLSRNTPKIKHPNSDLHPFHKCGYNSNQ